MAWHDSFDRMKVRPHILVVCPQAVGSAWKKAVSHFDSRDQKPWDHQREASDWLYARHAGMLAMEVGTGKTLAALMAVTRDGGSRPTECLDLTSGSGAKRAAALGKALENVGNKRLVVTVNYEACWQKSMAPALLTVQWSAIVLDESHRIKSPKGKASRWLAKLGERQPRARRYLMTGTPMPHSPLDLYGQFRFLDPGVFGTSFSGFRSRYAICDAHFHSKVKKWINQDELGQRLASHSFRVTADDVLDLPSSLHDTIPVPLSTTTRRFYKTLERDMVASIADGTVTVGNALTKLLRLQQATGGYCRMDDHGMPSLLDGVPAKRLALADRLGDMPTAEPVVVFCKFRTDLNEIAAMARHMGREYAEVSGERKDLERWQAGEATILGVQIASGGAGIDLTRACYAFYYSLGFSLGEYLQSLGRLMRPGQTRCVRYYHLVSPGTVDEHIYAALRERRSVVDGVLESLGRVTA